MGNNNHKKEIEILKKIGISTSRKRKVKCLIVAYDNKDAIIASFVGYNQSIMDIHDFDCEYILNDELKVNPYTIHAESLALMKFMKDYHKFGNEIKTISIYCTTAPCVECSKEIVLMSKLISPNTDINLIYGDFKDSFNHFHSKTFNQNLIPAVVLKSCKIRLVQNDNIKIENLCQQ